MLREKEIAREEEKSEYFFKKNCITYHNVLLYQNVLYVFHQHFVTLFRFKITEYKSF